ncbi:hypothetical protein DE146DRAFT_405323 [Phaeosphaeria sp. MPI-PUGE-AT-0046c]|nr:hypothetical protein DE146DRAFT_405323 [Phaeosphaeria sp. MPI-PUGE-AT-0046c]
MTDRSQASSGRDFGFQTSDQAGATSQQHPQHAYGQYNADQNANAPGVADTPLPAHLQDPSMRYQDFGLPHQQPAPGQYSGYGFSPSAALGWDWTNSIDFSEFTAQYEPQGELAVEIQQPLDANDFSIPLPVSTIESVYQTPHASNVVTPNTANAQNPLSPPPKPPQRPVVQTGMKRKADSEPDSAVSQTTSAHPESQQNLAKRPHKSRQSSTNSLPSPVVTETRQSPMAQSVVAQAAPEPISQENTEVARKKEQSKGTGPQGRVIDVSKPRRVVESPGGPDMLPAGKVFPIQIGSELFRLSGASISSDAPSYFSHFFGEQLHNNGGRAGDVRTLYIDRDPDTFREIALHLQGYHITPKDGEQFVKLFADAQFYSLPRLTKQLFSTDIFIRIGGTPFQIPRDLFSSPGDSPNYFSLGFAQFFSTPSEVFPGLDRNALLRPPSISPPSAPSRDGETFAELIRILQGYTPEIRNETHRAQLLRDARYFHLKGLEQRLIPCEISYNLKRQHSEILIRLEDIRQSGVSFSVDKPLGDSESSSTHGASPSAASPAPSLTSISSSSARAGYVSYARPYTDDHAQTKILVLETSSNESTTLYLPSSAPHSPHLNIRATFHNSTLARITSLFSVIASKMGLPATQPLGLMYLQTGSGVAAQPVSPANSGMSERRVRVRVDTDCALEIDGAPAEVAVDTGTGKAGIRSCTGQREWIWGGPQPDGMNGETEWVVKRAHWRLRVEPVEYEGERRMQVVLCGVKMEAFSVESRRNAERGFLGSA